MSKPLSPATIRFELQQRYRQAMDKALAATNPEERSRWASEAALAISELQHPSLCEKGA